MCKPTEPPESKSADPRRKKKIAHLNAVIPEIYDELHKRAEAHLRRERPGHTLQPTALIHEVYLRLLREKTIDASSRSHFLAIASKKMREILVNRCRPSPRRPPKGAVRVELRDDDIGVRDVDCLEFESALEKLHEVNPSYVEMLSMRLVGGMDTRQIADELGQSQRNVQRLIKRATMLLFGELNRRDQ